MIFGMFSEINVRLLKGVMFQSSVVPLGFIKKEA